MTTSNLSRYAFHTQRISIDPIFYHGDANPALQSGTTSRAPIANWKERVKPIEPLQRIVTGIALTKLINLHQCIHKNASWAFCGCERLTVQRDSRPRSLWWRLNSRGLGVPGIIVAPTLLVGELPSCYG